MKDGRPWWFLFLACHVVLVYNERSHVMTNFIESKRLFWFSNSLDQFNSLWLVFECMFHSVLRKVDLLGEFQSFSLCAN
jgi:predicted membrane protein